MLGFSVHVGAAPVDRLRVRKKNLLVVAGCVSCVYMLNVVLMLAGGDDVLKNDLEALRLTFHALLVLGVSGLYTTDRNRVWVITAYVYLMHTSLALLATACLANIPSFYAFAAMQVLANVALLGAFYRYRLTTTAEDDDSLPITPTAHMRAPYVAVCGVYAADLLYTLAVIYHAPSPHMTWLDWVQSQNISVGTAGHQAVLITIGLFAVVKKLKQACNAYILVGAVSAISQAAEVTHMLDDPSQHGHKIPALVLCVCARLVSCIGLHVYKEHCNAPGRYLHTVEQVEEGERLTKHAWVTIQGFCWMHAITWFGEGMAMVCLHRDGDLIHMAIGAGVSGAHGAILLGVQALNSAAMREYGRDEEKLKKLGFHTVLCIFYLTTALAAFACNVWRTGAESNIVTASSLVRGLCMGGVMLVVLKIEPCFPLNHLRYERFVKDDAADTGLYYTGDVEPLQHKAAIFSVAVVVLVLLLLCAVPFYSHPMATPVALPHTPSDALAFHFSFLFAIHVFVAIYCHRRVSAAFVVYGIGYIVPLCVLTGALLTSHMLSASVLFLLAASLTGTGYYLACLMQLYHHYPEAFPGGNIGWK